MLNKRSILKDTWMVQSIFIPLFFLLITSVDANAATVGVLYPELREPYSKVFDAIILGIEDVMGNNIDRHKLIKNFNIDAIEERIQRKQNKVILALGMRSVKAVSQLSNDIPVVLGAVLPSSVGVENTAWSGIFLVPDPDLIFEQLKLFAPNISKVSVVYNPAYNNFLIEKAVKYSADRGIKLDARPVEDIREAALVYKRLLDEVETGTDAIWLLRDPTSVDTDVILPLVLQEAWNRAVVTFSNHLVHTKRGALFSLYPDNKSMGKALAKLAESVLSQSQPQGFVTLKTLKIAVNLRTAKHLGIKFTSRQEKSFDLVFPHQ